MATWSGMAKYSSLKQTLEWIADYAGRDDALMDHVLKVAREALGRP